MRTFWTSCPEARATRRRYSGKPAFWSLSGTSLSEAAAFVKAHPPKPLHYDSTKTAQAAGSGKTVKVQVNFLPADAGPKPDYGVAILIAPLDHGGIGIDANAENCE